MSARLGRSFDDDSSVDSREQFAKEDLDNKAGGLTDCLDGKRHALVVTDIAELLSISERQVYKLVAAHRIPCFKIGGLIRFRSIGHFRMVTSENVSGLRRTSRTAAA